MSLLDLSSVSAVYLACGYTDMRRSIDGLAAIVEQQFRLDPFSVCDTVKVPTVIVQNSPSHRGNFPMLAPGEKRH